MPLLRLHITKLTMQHYLQQTMCRHSSLVSCTFRAFGLSKNLSQSRAVFSAARSFASESSPPGAPSPGVPATRAHPAGDNDLPETVAPNSTIEKRTPPVPIIYHPTPPLDKRAVKREERLKVRYDIMPTEVLIYDNTSLCQRLKWTFFVTGFTAGFSWTNLFSLVFQDYLDFAETTPWLAKYVELITLYKHLPADMPFHTQVFIFLQASLISGCVAFYVHQVHKRQFVRLYLDMDYGRFKGIFVEVNKYNERTIEFSYKDVVPVTHPLPHVQNFFIRGLPYYIKEADFKHPKYYAYFRGAFTEILSKKV